MQLRALVLLGCCILAHTASISDSVDTSRKIALSNSENTKESVWPENSRVKRSGGGLLSGIGSAIINKVAGASSSGGHGHSAQQYEHVEYGPPVYSYEEKNFDIWSFKKAILNTLFQALKAIGGGVIALKGQLIKGGGIVVATKGKILSAKGEAITSLGRHLAASAVLTPPAHHHGYAYETPVHVPPPDHGHTYDGPPPSAYAIHADYGTTGAASDSYGHIAYATPSDDAAHAGLIILKPVKTDEVHHHNSYRGYQDTSASDQQPITSENLIEPRQPNTVALAESFGGMHKDVGPGSGVKTPPNSKGKTMEEITYELTHMIKDDCDSENVQQSKTDNHDHLHYEGLHEVDAPALAPVQPNFGTNTQHPGAQHLNLGQYKFQDANAIPRNLHSNALVESFESQFSSGNAHQFNEPNTLQLPTDLQSVSIGNYFQTLHPKTLEIPILTAPHLNNPHSLAYGPDFGFRYNPYDSLKQSSQIMVSQKTSDVTIQPSISYSLDNLPRYLRNVRL